MIILYDTREAIDAQSLRYPPPIATSRRTLFAVGGGLALGAVAGVAGRDFLDKLSTAQQVNTDKTPDATPAPEAAHEVYGVERPYELSTKPYQSPEANTLAEQFSITSQTYFEADEQKLRELFKKIDESGVLTEVENSGLLPIFPPSVMWHRELIEQTAAEQQVPANLLAMIITVESCGNPDAVSADRGYGLTQITMPYQWDKALQTAQAAGLMQPNQSGLEPSLEEHDMYFKRTYEDKMDPDYAIIPSWGAYSDYRAAFTDPFVNATVGASYLSECLQAASNIYGGPLKAESLSRAAACYNGGIDEADKPVEQMPGYTIAYKRYAERFVMDMAIAAGLRSQGLSDKDILRAIQPTDEMDAMMYAYEKVYADNKQTVTSGAQQATMNQFAQAHTVQELPVGAQVEFWRYMRGSNSTDEHIPPEGSSAENYTTPAPTWLRFWLQNGGKGLFNTMPENTNWRRHN